MVNIVQSDYPPDVAFDKFFGASTRHTRRVEIYEQDGITRWVKDTIPRLKDGKVSVDYSRDERRTLDLVLDNSDGVLVNAPGEFWYDKIIKVFRGIVVEQPSRPPRILIVSDKTSTDSMAASMRAVLVNAGFGDVAVNPLVTTATEMLTYDVVIALSNATGGQLTALTTVYRTGGKILIFDTDAVTWAASTFTGEVASTVSPGPVSPTANSSHRVAQGWSTFSGLGVAAPSAQDTFTRTVSSGWGSSDDGQAWTLSGGVSADYSVSGTYGQITMPTITARETLLNSLSLTDFDTTVDIMCPQLPLTQPITVWSMGRRSDGSNYYLAVASFNTTGAIDLTIQKRVAGTFSTIATLNSAIPASFSLTDFYRLRFSVIGTSLRAKIWLASASEPVAWSLTITDASLTTAGVVGFRASPNTGNTNTNPTMRFDNVYVSGIALGDTTAYNYSAVTTDTVTNVAPYTSSSSVARIAAAEDPASGGRAVIVSTLINNAMFSDLNFGKMIASSVGWLNPYVPIDQWETQIGEFMIDRISEPNFPHEVRVTGRDYTKKCMQSKFPTAVQYDPGYNLEALIESLASSAGIRKTALPATGITIGGGPYAYERGTPRWDVMKEFAGAYNYELFFDSAGTLIMRKFVDPSTDAPVLYIETGENGSIVKFEKTTTDTRIYNYVVVYGESSDQGVSNAYAIAINTDPTSPTNVDEIGERVYTYANPKMTTNAQCQATADAFLAVHSLEEFELNFETLVLPWLEVGQIIGFEDPNPAPGDPTNFLLTTLDLPLSLGPMSGNARRTTIVG